LHRGGCYPFETTEKFGQRVPKEIVQGPPKKRHKCNNWFFNLNQNAEKSTPNPGGKWLKKVAPFRWGKEPPWKVRTCPRKKYSKKGSFKKTQKRDGKKRGAGPSTKTVRKKVK